MTNYTRGRALEYKVKKIMEDKGYFVIRSAGSHGPVDLQATCGVGPDLSGHVRTESWIIQCKTKDNGRSSKEKKNLIKLAKKLGAGAVWWSNNHGRVNLWV